MLAVLSSERRVDCEQTLYGQYKGAMNPQGQHQLSPSELRPSAVSSRPSTDIHRPERPQTANRAFCQERLRTLYIFDMSKNCRDPLRPPTSYNVMILSSSAFPPTFTVLLRFVIFPERYQNFIDFVNV